MADHNDFGKLAEELAENFLVEKNYKILAKNYRYLKAEIDIIAQFENQIVIVEVKARATDAFMLPQEAINKKKIRLIVSAANEFLETNNIELETRFDVISVLPNEKGKLEITHIENAFYAFDAN
ncbi:YraN family protein [Cloacibacterium sp.]|jgi:putative endonuclease|uniref:YraN family protein n=1 Tax=Cloacibacterium sp. TaxID=1913682 RepID=UPI0035B21940